MYTTQYYFHLAKSGIYYEIYVAKLMKSLGNFLTSMRRGL